ncbi:hypothetical protein [Phyllobacterium sp. SB3]|uniref:hypothetical protein n=1 Tax=Phyllobacterium sp. SB3 TaxID=3156073 RepID=UPI0032AFAB3A
MEKKASRRIYFTGLILGFVTLVSGCAQVYYGSFRYEADCFDRPSHNDTVCTVEKTK